MGSVFLFVLLIFNVCLVIPFVTCKNNCGANDYTIIDAHGAFIRCLTCATCHPGLGLDPLCGSSIQDPPDNIKCVRCKAGTFSSQYDSSPCYACHQCAEQELITKPCSDKSNTVCSGKCKKGYFFRKMAHHDCQKCCKCVMDGKDEKITECVDQGLSEHCSARPDKECESSETAHASKGGGLSTTTVSVIGVIGAVVVIALVILALYLNHRRKKRNRELSQQAEAPADHQLNDITPSQAYASKGPTTESSIRSQVRFSEPPLNPTYQGTPCGSQDQLEVKESVPFHATKHDVSQLPSDSVQKTAAVSTKSTGKRVELPEEKERKKPSLGRQGSQDSQTSGDGEAKFRKRSGSALSFAETIKRKFSDRDDSLIEEDPDVDDSHEPIKIVTHPKSQTAKEGSKVELKCKVEGNSTNLLYQWYKDDCAVIGQNNANLVLEAVELKDFGRYTCRVSYRDSYGEGENSSPAILDVIPQNLNATRPKLLTELDIETRDEVASLLENKRFGLGGCRQVAAKYGMKNHQIGALDNSKQPGQDVMEFLEGKKPNLTVYSFCKTLKENNIERFDIVKILENHFLKREGTNEYV